MRRPVTEETVRTGGMPCSIDELESMLSCSMAKTEPTWEDKVVAGETMIKEICVFRTGRGTQTNRRMRLPAERRPEALGRLILPMPIPGPIPMPGIHGVNVEARFECTLCFFSLGGEQSKTGGRMRG